LMIREVIDDSSLKICMDVQRLQSFVVYFRTSPTLSDAFYQFSREQALSFSTFTQDVITRWNSTFFMIQNALKARDTLLDFFKSPIFIENFKFTLEKKFSIPDLSLFSRLRSYASVLEPFAIISRWAEGEKYVTLAHVPQWINDLSIPLQISEDDPIFLSEFKQAMRFAFEKQFQWISECVNLSLKAAALHPLHGHLSFLNTELKAKVWQSLEKECTIYYSNIPSHQKELYLAMCKASLALIRGEFENQANIDAWKSEKNFSALNWWKQQNHVPLLIPIVKMLLCIPATSAPSERLFSAAGNVQKRCNLNPENLEAYTLIRAFIHSDNYDFNEVMAVIQERASEFDEQE
jgi:hypothetical protein